MRYSQMSYAELCAEHKKLTKEYEDIKNLGLSLDISRGKPGAEQLDLSDGILTVISSSDDAKVSADLIAGITACLTEFPRSRGCFRTFSVYRRKI